MSREIKFRAWIESEKRMVTPYMWINKSNFPAQEITIKPTAIMQYTGLKDKKGVEIYEYMELDDNFEVRFQSGCYILTNISSGDIMLLCDYLSDKNGQVKVTKEYTKI